MRIDLNVGTPEIFEESQKRILGEDHVAPMIAFGTFKKKSAFKLYAKSQDMDFDLANNISSQISEYEEALKNAEEDEEIDLYDYVNKEYEEYIEKSKKYWGIISDKKKAPSAYLLYQGNVRREIGLIKCKSESTKKEVITCVIDGAIAENYKFLKNDILTVNVVWLIDQVFKRIGIEHFGVNELLEKIKDDDEFWRIYSKGYTLGLNQVERESSKHKCMNYKPQNISELSAFVAAIRPGFKSMYDRFERREDFKWGIPALDNLIRTKELPVSFLFFQEQVMTVLNYAGFPMDKCYGIIKAIAKKHPEKVKPLKKEFIKGFEERIIEDENISKEQAEKYSKQVWQIVNDNCNYSFNCISGETRILKGARNHHFNPTIEEMYKIRNDKEYAYETKHKDLHKKYQCYGYGTALSMFDDNLIHQNRIADIQEAGIRQTYKLITESGASIVCTDNHKFPTPKGKKRLDELKIGDELYCKGKYKQEKFNSSLTDGNFKSNVPKKGEQGFQKRPNGASVVYERERLKHKNNKDGCDICDREYDGSRFELHHKDFNRHNNCLENYMWLCCSCHKKIHYQNGRTGRYQKGIETYLSKIISIEPYKVEMTYDIMMDDPAHNFVTESGLVASNSSHAYCMAIDSSYQAWQKAHYPYEFYEVLLQYYAEKGNKDKVSALKAEMKKAFGISEGAYRFRADNRRFSADKEHQCINPALSSIKGFSVRISEDLYRLGQKEYSSFLKLLDIISKSSVNKTQLDILIKINYFEEFGEPNYLLRQAELYNQLKGKKVIKKDKTDVPEYMLSKYCDKETEKQYRFTEEGMDDLLKAMCKKINVKKASKKQIIRWENEYLGYISTVYPNAKDRYYFVQGINNNWAMLYHLQTGKSLKIKFRKNKYKNNPFKEKDFIKIIQIKEEPKWSKDTNGDWLQNYDDLEDILFEWKVVN